MKIQIEGTKEELQAAKDQIGRQFIICSESDISYAGYGNYMVRLECDTNETKDIDYGKELELKFDGKVDKHKDSGIWIICNLRNDSTQLRHLALLKHLLAKVGIQIEATQGKTVDFLRFKIDFDVYKQATSRNAGRKKSYNRNGRYKDCTVSELKEKLKTMPKANIAKELGCSRSMFYRILENVNFDAEYAQDTSIWYYTGEKKRL